MLLVIRIVALFVFGCDGVGGGSSGCALGDDVVFGIGVGVGAVLKGTTYWGAPACNPRGGKCEPPPKQSHPHAIIDRGERVPT